MTCLSESPRHLGRAESAPYKLMKVNMPSAVVQSNSALLKRQEQSYSPGGGGLRLNLFPPRRTTFNYSCVVCRLVTPGQRHLCRWRGKRQMKGHKTQ